MLKKSPYIVIVLLVAVFACSKKANRELKKSEKFGQAKPLADYEVQPNEKFDDIEVYTRIKQYVDSLKQQYDSVVYFCDLDTNFLFYVIKGKWHEPVDKSGRYLSPGGSYKMGVVDKNGHVIIPVKYDKIYNPGGTVANCIEVELNNEKGLYTLNGELAVEVKYDVLYPSPYEDVLVQVRYGNEYGIIKNREAIFDTTQYEKADMFKSPYNTKQAANWKFDVNAEQVLFLQPAFYQRYESDPVEGRGIVFAPSYLNELGFIPAYQAYIVMEKESDFGTAESKGKISMISDLWNGIKAAFAEYYEVGLDARGYETNKNSLHTIDSVGNMVDALEYYLPYIPVSPCGKDNEMFSARFVSNGLFEVKTYVYSYESESGDTTYNTYHEYLYYHIDSSGKINRLTTPRRFAFTKYVSMDESYLKGCFAKYADLEGRNNALIREHMSLNDLEIMKNEIYAEYGLIFKTGKWKNYFEKKSWYKPVLTTVDHVLTETDRHNLAFISMAIEKMKNNPDEYEQKPGNIILMP